MSEPIFLGTMQQLLEAASDEEAARQLRVLANVLSRLDYRLASGQEPKFHELWAMQIEPAPPLEVEPPPEDPADAFERTFLAWVSIHHGRLPEERAGTNACYWVLPFFDSNVSFVIIGHGKNSSLPPPAGEDWVLKIEEAEPAPFIKSVEPYFEKASNRRMIDGRVRVQFRSSKLIRPFEDQTDRP
ncbi:MAG: hypothetical protein K2Y23_02910 [Cyanobacteria bacterium]|nr:hypothetical protein [Cyanobacteriota bacterium]